MTFLVSKARAAGYARSLYVSSMLSSSAPPEYYTPSNVMLRAARQCGKTNLVMAYLERLANAGRLEEAVAGPRLFWDPRSRPTPRSSQFCICAVFTS